MHREQRRPAHERNDVWSIDFVSDELVDGRRFRALTVMELFTRFNFADYQRGLEALRLQFDDRDSAAGLRT